MSIRTDLSRPFHNPRRKLLSLCLLAMIAAGASAHSAGSPDATRQQGPAFIDPNGLEVDGAGSVESPVEVGTADLALLIICITLGLGALTIAVIDQHRSRSVTSERSRGGG
jgi:hypothetical protein